MAARQKLYYFAPELAERIGLPAAVIATQLIVLLETRRWPVVRAEGQEWLCAAKDELRASQFGFMSSFEFETGWNKLVEVGLICSRREQMIAVQQPLLLPASKI